VKLADCSYLCRWNWWFCWRRGRSVDVSFWSDVAWCPRQVHAAAVTVWVNSQHSVDHATPAGVRIPQYLAAAAVVNTVC